MRHIDIEAIEVFAKAFAGFIMNIRSLNPTPEQCLVALDEHVDEVIRCTCPTPQIQTQVRRLRSLFGGTLHKRLHPGIAS